MKLTPKIDIKYKLLNFSQLVINLDRLSRFKQPDESYFRVFSSILFNCLVQPKFSKKDIENIEPSVLSYYVSKIWNDSVLNLFPSASINDEARNVLKYLVEIPFKIVDEPTKILTDTKLFISPVLENINYEQAPQNLKMLIEANKVFNSNNKVTKDKLISFSNKNKLKYPIQKLVIVEGITEETLLPVFADKLNHNFDENGIFVLGAGGKSKSPSIYMKLKNILNIPVILLFDSDAFEVCNILQKNLLKKDKTIIINKGEFEDILSLNLIKRAINSEYDSINPLLIRDLHIYPKMCENIEYYFRTRSLGEFKKSKFSKLIAKNIKYKTDITVEINDIINMIT